LIERRRDPRDGRGTVIEATAVGLQQVDAVRKARRSLYGTVLHDYSWEERRELAATLERFTAALDAHMRTTKA
jgi:DNA-binding MarR family transcriptional regulator